MLKKSLFYSLLASILLFGCSVTWAKSMTPVGSWVQVSDVTNQPHSIIKIWEHQHVLYGKVVKGFPENGKMPPKYCQYCTGKRHNQPIVGMKILWGFYQTDLTHWVGGKILDPDNGKIYSCKLTLIDQGKALKVRGYIGISLFGRTQIWQRMKHSRQLSGVR